MRVGGIGYFGLVLRDLGRLEMFIFFKVFVGRGSFRGFGFKF